MIMKYIDNSKSALRDRLIRRMERDQGFIIDHSFRDHPLETLANIADEMELRIKSNDMSEEYALSIKNGIEWYALPNINAIYRVIPDGCDEEGQSYSSYWIENRYNSGATLAGAEVVYYKLYRVSRALAKYTKN